MNQEKQAKTRRRIPWLAVLVAAVALVVPASVFAQGDPDPGKDSCPREPEQPWHCDGIPDNDQDKYPYDPSNPPGANDPNPDPDPNDPDPSDPAPDPDPNDPDPPASDPGAGSGSGSGGEVGSAPGTGQTGGRPVPVGGVKTGAGGTADEGPDWLALAVAGGSLLLAATAGGRSLRRRTE